MLHTLAFDSVRKRMSVVVKDVVNSQYIVYCKGADNVILELLKMPSSENEGELVFARKNY